MRLHQIERLTLATSLLSGQLLNSVCAIEGCYIWTLLLISNSLFVTSVVSLQVRRVVLLGSAFVTTKIQQLE